MTKEYTFGELEKLLADKNYYLKNPEKTKELIQKTETLLDKLKEFTFDNKEKRAFFKTKAFLEKIKRLMK
jgi:hypothetical protein